MQHSYYAGAVAYQLHNFALAAATDFIGFNEEAFWEGLDYFRASNPMLDIGHYRKIFDHHLSESTN
ncbi:hypothetical protein [Hymenobacter terrestris]|uniref:DUF2252 domain-containing protein n=1 Tax=Hymenobacter terrestris TaxID=2748310 RepID=A0ABX2PXG2_9BACT|nr:hypothetical protein [Hymenobacter terrestris]NVO83377.1 hypothetical protein [Hymenobacter terrestris]